MHTLRRRCCCCIVEKSDKLFRRLSVLDGSGAKFLCARVNEVASEISCEAPADFNDSFPDLQLHKLFQNGKEVYKFATQALPKSFALAAEKIGITKDEIDWFIPHQANIG